MLLYKGRAYVIVQSYLVAVFEYITSFPLVVKHDYNGFSILI